ncbi:MAG TPA: phage tail assembly chaperone [Ligilactobacillus acidipiscis]|uniref:Phage tail assembly chaperone n=1 Tax=Ligilactobacillus acidipiscis TaxID=89059 RepID=A0A921K0N2_9LACO|nr:phage tail assembly chaperone [Ligilactobacillus acidipiscis]
MKIKVEQFKKTPFEVKASNKNVTAAYELQLNFAKVSQKMEQEDIDPMDIMQLNLDTTNHVIQFVCDILKLNDKQKDILEDMETQETTELATRISMRLMGMSEAEIASANEDKNGEEESPKK